MRLCGSQRSPSTVCSTELDLVGSPTKAEGLEVAEVWAATLTSVFSKAAAKRV